MSLFGSLMGDFEDDPIFGSHMHTMQRMQRMNNMINSIFADPFSMMGPPALMDHSQSHQPRNRNAPMTGMQGMQMMPFGFPPMPSLSFGGMFSNFGNMTPDPNCRSFTSSYMVTMTTGPDGRPQIYQETSSTRAEPGGVKETKKTVSDSRTGTRKMAIGHHIGERAHIIEREKNVHNGDQEERQEYINIEEEEAESFNREWETKTRRTMGAIGGSSYRQPNPYSRAQQENKPLALPSTVPTSSRQQSKDHSRAIPSPRRAIRSTHSSKSNNVSTPTSRSAENTSTSTNNSNSHHQASLSPVETVTSRKRERSPEPQDYSNKRLSHDTFED